MYLDRNIYQKKKQLIKQNKLKYETKGTRQKAPQNSIKKVRMSYCIPSSGIEQIEIGNPFLKSN